MSGRPIGVALVGAGNIAAAHIDAVGADPRARLLGITAERDTKARALAERHGVRHYPDVEAIAADPEVDLVAICTPSGAHLEPALAAIRAGKHVIVEKPLEVTSERARALIEAADAAGVTLSAIFNSRFADANAFVQRAVAEGRLGRMVQGDAYVKWFRDQAYYESADWRGTLRLDGGGALMNQAIHHLDLLLWIMGPVREVFAYADTLTHRGLEVEDTLVAVFRYESGALGHIAAATSLWPGRPKLLQIHGEDGVAVVEDDMLVDWRTRAGGEAERDEALARYGGQATGGAADPMAISFENHRRQYRDVIDALASGRAPAIDGREGVRAIEVIEAIYRSVREHRPVYLSGDSMR
ncbi:MAG: Gfo/Idh/MocA family protein [Trueperaceae bacterium]